YDEMSKRAGSIVRDRLLKKANLVLGLATGSTPEGLYKELIRLHKEEGLSFKDVVTFNLDEYCGLSPDHPQSYHYFMREKLFKDIDIKPENTHVPEGLSKNPEEFCQKYEEEIKKYGGIELFLGGIGPDGHIAFNEPGSSLHSRTRVKTLTYDTILANSRFFNDDMSKVPTQALTVGVGTVMDAREVVIIITGFNKARAVREVIEGGISHMWTVSMLQLHEHAVISLDEPATMELQVESVKYFKDIEEISQSKMPIH
ncbi:MAG: glucosamine-6-phosphate deaminase, partial [Bacteroidales bacterium]|nr:glucosamine-6-phosphate deaminase [Bacteroidales bacterium]